MIVLCKICKLDILRKEAIESMILNEGTPSFRIKSKPLSIPQICFIMFISYHYKISRQTIYKHMYQCMNLPKIRRGRNRTAQIEAFEKSSKA